VGILTFERDGRIIGTGFRRSKRSLREGSIRTGNTVRAEPVEALPFAPEERGGFDKLSPNGVKIDPAPTLEAE
jgi:hypothetical protein